MKEWLYAANQAAALYFINTLCVSPEGLGYLRKRGLSDDMLRRSWAGWADGKLTAHLRSRGFADEVLIGAGLSIRGEDGRVYDRFRRRVVFPVFDWNYRICGFSGRTLEESPDIPKYLNTPGTEVFQKGDLVFGWNDLCYTTGFQIGERKLPYMIMCEGNLDVIALHQAGFVQSGASLGTAFTPSQAHMLSLVTDLVVLAYDADRAGRAATKKNIAALRDAGVPSRVLVLEGAKDPDEFLKKFGAGAFKKALLDARRSYEWELDYAVQRVEEEKDPFFIPGEPAAQTRVQEEALRALGDEYVKLGERERSRLEGYAALVTKRFPWLKGESAEKYLMDYALSVMAEGT